jgi:hypothetical protein
MLKGLYATPSDYPLSFTTTLTIMQNGSILLMGLLFFCCMSQQRQKPDLNFDVSVKSPAFTGSQTKVLFDEAHNNSHTSTGTYSPFVKLITNDGCSVFLNKNMFTDSSLANCDILVIANAKGSPEKYLPAFSTDECAAVERWVRKGGSLLLIADHYPFGITAENLSVQFGVHMFSGETTDSIHFEGNEKFRDKLVFSRENKLLLDNAISKGLNERETLYKVVSDRGQSLSVPDSAMVLLKLSPSAYHVLPDSIWKIDSLTYTRFRDPVSAYGNCQGLALLHGKGRVVILGEAAMITAQKFGFEKFGMNSKGNDNKQFALNIVRWLGHKISP